MPTTTACLLPNKRNLLHGKTTHNGIVCPCKECKAKRSAQQRQRYARINKLIEEIKDVPCQDCGNTFPPECMDFDHARGEKSFTIGQMKAHYSRRRLLDEIDKCDVVCANCHRTRTKKRRNGIEI